MTRALWFLVFLVLISAHLVHAQTPQLVLIGRGVAPDRLDDIVISTSRDGVMWTPPSSVLLNGAPVQTLSAPNIFSDGTLYNLLWLAPDGQVRYAVSSDAMTWLAQQNPLARLPPASGPWFAQGGGTYLALVDNVVLDLNNSASRTTITDVAESSSICFGNNKFVVAVVGRDLAVRVFESPGATGWTQTGTAVPAASAVGRTASISFAEGKFFLAVTTGSQNDIPPDHCTYFESPDAHSWTQDSLPTVPCSNTYTGLLLTQFRGQPIVLGNINNMGLSEPTVFGTWRDLPIVVNGQPSVTEGPAPRPTITPVSATCVTINATLNAAIAPVTMMASGGTGSGYTFVATGLPSGLTMSTGGTISGTPTASRTVNYTVTITDSGGNRGTVNCSLTVSNFIPGPSCQSLHFLIPTIACPPPYSQTCGNVPQVAITPCTGTTALVVVYSAPASHCSTMELKLWLTTAGTNVQGPQLLTDPVAPLQSKAVILPFPSGFTPDGQRQLVLNLQAIGLLGGCNTGSLQGWAGSLDISFVQ